VARRIERLPPTPEAPARPATPAESIAAAPLPAGAAPPARLALICGACQTGNDPDARFCKGCGARLEVA
jgi:hypothetical protein